jgi:hypothetical protein
MWCYYSNLSDIFLPRRGNKLKPTGLGSLNNSKLRPVKVIIMRKRWIPLDSYEFRRPRASGNHINWSFVVYAMQWAVLDVGFNYSYIVEGALCS